MNRNLRGAFSAFIIICLLLSVLIFLPEKYVSRPIVTPTPRSEDTITPTSTNTFFFGQTIIDSACRSGTNKEHEVITTIPQGTGVLLIGKDSNQANWLLIRWGGPTDCWVEKRFVSTPFDIALFSIILTPPAPTFTPTQTKVVVTHTPTQAILGTGYINRATASVWEEPNSRLIIKLGLNQLLTLLEMREVGGSIWYRCRWDKDGTTQEGWILAEYINVGNPPP